MLAKMTEREWEDFWCMKFYHPEHIMIHRYHLSAKFLICMSTLNFQSFKLPALTKPQFTYLYSCSSPMLVSLKMHDFNGIERKSLNNMCAYSLSPFLKHLTQIFSQESV